MLKNTVLVLMSLALTLGIVPRASAKVESNNEINCIAKAVYAEARGESREGQRAIAHVILNRMRDNDMTACEVISSRGQFTYDHRFKVTEKEAYHAAQDIAREALEGEKDPTHGAISFHIKKVHPCWDSKMKRTVTIGHHYFYRERNES